MDKKEKTHNANKASKFMLVYPRHDLTTLISQYLLLIIHSAYAPVKPHDNHHL